MLLQGTKVTVGRKNGRKNEEPKCRRYVETVKCIKIVHSVDNFVQEQQINVSKPELLRRVILQERGGGERGRRGRLWRLPGDGGQAAVCSLDQVKFIPYFTFNADLAGSKWDSEKIR